MVREFLKRRIAVNRGLIIQESRQFSDFMGLLMKGRNTGVPWTGEETIRIRRHLIRLILYVPVLAVFILPFGSLLLPVLAEALDRRKRRGALPKTAGGQGRNGQRGVQEGGFGLPGGRFGEGGTGG
jgi:hypothetical protein